MFFEHVSLDIIGILGVTRRIIGCIDLSNEFIGVYSCFGKPCLVDRRNEPRSLEYIMFCSSHGLMELQKTIYAEFNITAAFNQVLSLNKAMSPNKAIAFTRTRAYNKAMSLNRAIIFVGQGPSIKRCFLSCGVNVLMGQFEFNIAVAFNQVVSFNKAISLNKAIASNQIKGP